MENDEYIPNEDALSDRALGARAHCDQCDREFASPWGLRVHQVRVHSDKGWDTTANLTKRRPKGQRYPSESAAYKKRKYQETKAKYLALGLNARGLPFKSQSRPRKKIKPIVYRGTPDEIAEESRPVTVTGILSEILELIGKLERHLS